MKTGSTAPASDYLTTREVARLLRLKERRVYDLAARGEIPCVRATGRLLFPRREIERWLASSSWRRSVDPVIAGSHDPLLEWALRESGSGIASFFDGSLDGLRRMREGRAAAAGVHLWEDDLAEWNLAHVRDALGDAPVVLIEWSQRQQGLLLPPGNPRRIRGLGGLAGLRVVPRQEDSGAWLLFRELMRRADVPWQAVEFVSPAARTETEAAMAVLSGRADAGFGLVSMASELGLEAVPLCRERFDLVLFRRTYFEPPFQRLFAFARSDAFLARARELSGYDISGLGTVRFNAP